MRNHAQAYFPFVAVCNADMPICAADDMFAGNWNSDKTNKPLASVAITSMPPKLPRGGTHPEPPEGRESLADCGGDAG